MPSLQIVSSRIQKLVGSPTSRRSSKRLPKSSQTSVTPFSPRITLLEPIDRDHPLLNASHSSMLSAVTTTGVHPLPHSSSRLSSLSFAKSESCLPHLPALPFSPHPNTAESIGDRQSEAGPSSNVGGAFPQSLGVPAEDSTLSGITVDKEDTEPLPGPPNTTERGGRTGNSTGPTNYHESPNSASDSSVKKDEHETYLDNLRLLHFGVTVESTGTGDDFLSEFPLISEDASWVEINLQSYDWQV